MKRYLIIFLIVLISLNIVSYLYFDKVYSSNTQYYLKSKLKVIESNYKNATDIFELYAQLIFINNIQTDEIYHIIRYLPNASEYEQNNIRNELYEHILSLYKVLKQEVSVRQMHFHLPDGRSFLRMHRPEKFGDHLFDVRPLVKIANSKLIYVKGFEEGRIFNGYRYVFPLIIKNQHFGSVEISVSINALAEYMKKLSSSDYCFMLKKIIVDEKVFPDEKSNYQTSILSPWFLHDKVVNHDYCTNTIARILEKIKDDKNNIRTLENSLSLSTAITEEDKTYTAEFLPITNTLNNTIAYIFSVNEDPIYPQYRLNFISNLMLTFIGSFSFLSCILFLIYRNQYIRNQNIELKNQVEQRSEQLNQSLEKEKQYIQLFDVIEIIRKKILLNTKLDEVLQFCVNHFTTIPSCIFSIISVNLDNKYFFYSDNCEQYSSNKKLICEKVSTLMQSLDVPSKKQMVVIDNLREEINLIEIVDALEECKIKQIIILPLNQESPLKHIGNLFFFTSRIEPCEEHEQQLFNELSKSISSAIIIESKK